MDRFKGSKKQMYLLSNQYSFLFEKFVGESDKATQLAPSGNFSDNNLAHSIVTLFPIS